MSSNSGASSIGAGGQGRDGAQSPRTRSCSLRKINTAPLPTPPPPPLPPVLPSPVTEARLGAVCPWTSSDGPPGHSSGWEGVWVVGANKGILLTELLKHPCGPLQNEVASSKPECTRDSQVGFSLMLRILSISGKPAVHHPEYHSTNCRPPGKHRRMPSPERGVQGPDTVSQGQGNQPRRSR